MGDSSCMQRASRNDVRRIRIIGQPASSAALQSPGQSPTKYVVSGANRCSNCARRKQTRPRLPATALVLRTVTTVVHLRDVSSRKRHLQHESVRDDIQVLGRKNPFADACLVGEDDRCVAVVRQQAQAFQHPRQKLELAPRSDVAPRHPLVDHAVSVQQHIAFLSDTHDSISFRCRQFSLAGRRHTYARRFVPAPAKNTTGSVHPAKSARPGPMSKLQSVLETHLQCAATPAPDLPINPMRRCAPCMSCLCAPQFNRL